ncbi:MAG: sigma-70 family RNA polymerase sigma factor [Myxococcota bacterium]
MAAVALEARDPSGLATLTRDAMRGDRRSLERLLPRLTRRMLRTAHGVLGRREDAEDVTQEALVVVARTLGELRQPDAVAAYADRIVLRLALRLRQRRAQTETRTESIDVDGKAVQLAAIEPRGDEELVLRQKIERALALLDRLPSAQAEVILMRFVEGYTAAEVAAAEGVSVHTVNSRVRLAKQRLERFLSAAKLRGEETP